MKNPNRKLRLSIWCVFMAAVLILNILVTQYALSWDRALGSYFGYLGGSTSQAEGGETLSAEELGVRQKELELEIVSQGAVLLRNENNALPLAAGSRVSVFGQTAQMWMTKERITGTKDTVFLESLESAGLEVNGELRKFYKQSKHTNWGIGANLGDGGIAGTWEIDEVPLSEYTDAVRSSYAGYADAAIVVFSRGGSEGGDLPRDMERFGGRAGQGYLELTDNELDLLGEVTAHFDKVIVVLHTTNAMDMDFVRDYDIDAVLWVSGTGQDGVEVMGKYFTGEINPSGKNIDTYVYDNFSAPAMQNFSDFRFTQNGQPIRTVTSTVGGTYSYMNYAESIYVGYKYYETRYEDYVLNQGNAGSYRYDDTVFAPFGYGLSYTSFDWSDFSVSEPDGEGNMTVSVKVTNTGAVPGREVVEVYYQAPYTQYDIQNRVEKAAVNLIEFGKTGLLGAGDSETVTLTVNLRDMKSYDAFGAGTYILEAGSYYITAARDAHQAVNNILTAKGADTARMSGTGDAAFVASHTVSALETLDTAVTGNKIVNQYDHAYMEGAVYLSRSDWSAMDNGGLTAATGTLTGLSNTTDAAGTVLTMEISAPIYSGLTSEGWNVSGNPVGRDDSSWPAVRYGIAGEWKLQDMGGLAYDDPKWDSLLDQLNQAESVVLAGKSGWGSEAAASIGKNETFFMDGPQGMIDYVSGGQGYQFTDENLLGATWNKELVAQFGDLVSREFAMKGAGVWWAPAINMHRTAYSGRNFEYYSEDGVFNGLMGSVCVKAAMNNRVAATLKHFFLNDQETNRGANGRIATFATEQAIREIYLKPFELCVVDAGAVSIMSSMGRIGWRIVPGDYSTNTAVLRNEWGFTGGVITDAQSLTPLEAEQALAAGCDMVCSMAQTEYVPETLASPGGQYMLRTAVKNQLFETVNTISITLTVTKGFPIYWLLLIGLYLLQLMLLAYGTAEVLMGCYPEQTILSGKGKKLLRGVVWGITAAALAVLLYFFFTDWLPMLQFAFQTAV